MFFPGIVLARLDYLQLSQGETTASTDPTVVLVGRAVDDGTQLVSRTGGSSGSLRSAGITAAVLTTGLYASLDPNPIQTSHPTPFRAHSRGSGVPGRSRRARAASSPCGSLQRVNRRLESRPQSSTLTLVENLVVVHDRL